MLVKVQDAKALFVTYIYSEMLMWQYTLLVGLVCMVFYVLHKQATRVHKNSLINLILFNKYP